jgi:uncharacterized protein YggT (Ycf19 family)
MGSLGGGAAIAGQDLAPGEVGAVADRPANDPVDPIRLVFGALQSLLLGRIVLGIVSVGRAVPVAGLILSLSDPIVSPFRRFAPPDPGTGPMPSLDVPAVLAFVAWTLVETACIATICIRDRRRCAGDPAPSPRIAARVVLAGGRPKAD